MSQNNVDLVKSIYGAIGVGDIDAVIGLMTDDVEIHFPGPESVPFAGVFQGHQGVGEFFTRLGSSADVELFEPIEFIAQGDKTVVTGRERLRAKASGKTWETVWAMVW